MRRWAWLFLAVLAEGACPDAARCSGRSKSLELEGEVLEGMSKDPSRNVESVGEGRKKRPSHLYRKKRDFQEEVLQRVKEMGMMP